MTTTNLGRLNFEWQGTYNSANAYVKDDVVFYNGNAYIALQSVAVNTLPTTLAPNWALYNVGLNGFVSKVIRPATQTGAIPAFSSARRVKELGVMPSVTGGHGKGLFLMEDQSIRSVGRSTSNANGDISDRYLPNLVAINDHTNTIKFTKVYDGGLSSFAIDTTGAVWAWGANANGQLGVGDTTDRILMSKVSLPAGVQISKVFPMDGTCYDPTFGPCTFFLTTTGKVYATGSNGNGQLGNGTTTQVVTPAQIADTSLTAGAFGALTITDLCVASYPTSVFAITNTGDLYSWGWNGYGALGIGNTTQQTKPVLTTLTGVKKVVCCTGRNDSLTVDYQSTIALKTDGTVWVTGYGGEGQLGLGNTTTINTWQQVTTLIGSLNITDVYMVGSPYASTFAITNDNKLYAWGANNYGALGLGDTNFRNAPVNVASLNGKAVKVKGGGNRFYHSVYVLGNDNNIYGAGRNNSGQLSRGYVGTSGTATYTFMPMLGIDGIIADYTVSGGNTDPTYVYVLYTDGRVASCGANGNGQCGSKANTSSQVLLGDMLF